MTTAAKKASKKASKKAAPVTRVNQIVTFHKAAKEDALPAQAATILSIVQSRKKLSVADLKKAMVGKVQTTQDVSKIWAFYRGQLIKSGYIKVVKAEKAA